MKMRIQLLHGGKLVQERLRSDGWNLRPESTGTLCASHSAIHSEPAARQRLYELGLLTSAALRIEFPIPSRQFSATQHTVTAS